MTIKTGMTQKTLQYFEKLTGKLTFGKLMNSIRLCDEMTQIEFAELLNISKSHLCDIEHDRKIVSPKLAAQYANKLGYDEAQFIRLAIQAMIDKSGLNYNVELDRQTRKVKKYERASPAAM